jgi:bis(5'-nucleosyl)-tetraphosphatase (symmetrical)
MVTYAIGDIQGCDRTLGRLLERLAAAGFDRSRDRLWLTGDLVNRGPRSLSVLRRIHVLAQPDQLGERLVCVLGNHDLRLLECAAGERRPGKSDTLDEVLAAPDRGALIDWLRHRPLLHRQTLGGREHVLVHAGLPPEWSPTDAEAHARELEAALAGPDWTRTAAVLADGGSPRFQESLRGDKRLCGIAAALTRMRTVRANGAPCADFKGAPAEAPRGCTPWYDAPGRASASARIVCGHWAALGLLLRDDLFAIDTACVWGGTLTAVRLEDRAVFSEGNAEGA